MKKKLGFGIIICLLLCVLTLPISASAYTGFKTTAAGKIKYYNSYGNLVKGTWFKVNGKFYYSSSKGYVQTGLKEIGGKLYYFTSKGVNKTGWITIKGKKYYFMKKTREAIRDKKYKFSNGKTYYFNASGVRCTGWQKVGDYYYYFNPNMKTGWITINTTKFYCYKTGTRKGHRASGLSSVGGKLYYFDPETGVMIRSSSVEVAGKRYSIDINGVCTLVTTYNATVTSDMLFFLTFESGSEAYNQTGGDTGKACGAYQFDYRYSLLPFIKYAYSKNKTLCAEFKKFAALSITTKNKNSLMNNKTLYKAWNTIYARNPVKFSKLQDDYARQEYYDPVESSLSTKGYSISGRAAVVKGAVYSYSIQHGASSAIAAVQAIKGKATMTNATFLKKLYDYRIKQFPAYKSRYTAEYNKALAILNSK